MAKGKGYAKIMKAAKGGKGKGGGQTSSKGKAC